MNLKDHFMNTVADELDHLNGTEFEYLCRPFIELLTDKEFEIKGHNLEMKPVGRTVDLMQDGDFGVIGQCGTDKDYFSGNKAVNDIDGCFRNSPDFHTIYLFSNRRATGSELTDLEKAVKLKLNSNEGSQADYQFYLYDSQRIAKTIYDKIYKTSKVKEILSYLPKSYNYYLCLPESNMLPMQKQEYRHRPEEKEIEERLEKNDFLQIYGLSGMGKTETAIAVANNLSDKFDTVLWLYELNKEYISLSDIHIQRLEESINLEHLLSMFRVLIVVDNLNDNVETLKDNFLSKSKNGSKCIVTSLQLNVSPAEAFNLKYLSDAVSKEILSDCKVEPTEEQLDYVLANVAGYPLLLKLAKNAVENGDLSWDEIVSISNLTEIDDNEKNEVFAQRIVGRYKDRFPEMFNLLLGLDSTRLSKHFLREKNIIKFNALLRNAIIESVDEYSCSIHSVVLSSIRTVVGRDYSEKDFLEHIDKYLHKHALSRDAGLYTFAAAHGDRLLMLFDDKNISEALRKLVLLACLYAFDTYSQPQRYTVLFEKVELHPSESELDLRLLIESQELEEKKLKIELNDDEFRKEKIQGYVGVLKGLSTDSEKSNALKYHHIGKWESIIGEYESAEKNLLKAIEISPTSFHSHLRLARNYNVQSKRNGLSFSDKECYRNKAIEQLNSILEWPDLSEVPISVKLSAYEMLGGNAYVDQRTMFVDNRLNQFAKDIYASLSESYSHTYNALSKLANHLSYNFPEFFSRLCAKLPLPLNIENNERLRKDYGEIVLAQYVFGNYPEKYREKLFRLAEEYLLSVPADDFVRKNLIKLYLKAGITEKAGLIAEDLEKSNEFNLQLLCKVCCSKGDFLQALEYIEMALAKDPLQKVVYRAAFFHDKAICLHGMGKPDAEAVMKEAIDLQPNANTKEMWQKELLAWSK